jgi:hypothetical protein
LIFIIESKATKLVHAQIGSIRGEIGDLYRFRRRMIAIQKQTEELDAHLEKVSQSLVNSSSGSLITTTSEEASLKNATAPIVDEGKSDLNSRDASTPQQNQTATPMMSPPLPVLTTTPGDQSDVNSGNDLGSFSPTIELSSEPVVSPNSNTLFEMKPPPPPASSSTKPPNTNTTNIPSTATTSVASTLSASLHHHQHLLSGVTLPTPHPSPMATPHLTAAPTPTSSTQISPSRHHLNVQSKSLPPTQQQQTQVLPVSSSVNNNNSNNNSMELDELKAKLGASVSGRKRILEEMEGMWSERVDKDTRYKRLLAEACAVPVEDIEELIEFPSK